MQRCLVLFLVKYYTMFLTWDTYSTRGRASQAPRKGHSGVGAHSNKLWYYTRNWAKSRGWALFRKWVLFRETTVITCAYGLGSWEPKCHLTLCVGQRYNASTNPFYACVTLTLLMWQSPSNKHVGWWARQIKTLKQCYVIHITFCTWETWLISSFCGKSMLSRACALFLLNGTFTCAYTTDLFVFSYLKYLGYTLNLVIRGLPVSPM